MTFFFSMFAVQSAGVLYWEAADSEHPASLRLMLFLAGFVLSVLGIGGLA